MKIAMILLFLLVANILFGQQSDKIVLIRKSVAEINNTRGYKVKTLSDDYFTSKDEVADNGHELKGYYHKDTLKKIVYSAGPSYGMKTFEFYFYDGNVIFAFEKEEVFPETKDGSLNYEKLVSAFEGRYYFDRGKIFQTKTKGQKRFSDNDKENILINLRRLLKDLNAKRG